jgi:hypothetical protein
LPCGPNPLPDFESFLKLGQKQPLRLGRIRLDNLSIANKYGRTDTAGYNFDTDILFRVGYFSGCRRIDSSATPVAREAFYGGMMLPRPARSLETGEKERPIPHPLS